MRLRQSPERAQRRRRCALVRPFRAFRGHRTVTQGGASLCPGLCCLRTFGAPRKALHFAGNHDFPILKSGAVQLVNYRPANTLKHLLQPQARGLTPRCSGTSGAGQLNVSDKWLKQVE